LRVTTSKILQLLWDFVYRGSAPGPRWGDSRPPDGRPQWVLPPSQTSFRRLCTWNKNLFTNIGGTQCISINTVVKA